MTQQTVNVGATPNDGTGDTLRAGFVKTNNNFTELYNNVPVGTTTAETAAGATPTAFQYVEGDVRRYGAIGAGEDNTAHINTALAVAAKSGRPALFAGLNLKSTGGHTRDVGTTAVDGQGAIINFSTMSSSGTAWTDTCTTGSGSTGNVQHVRLSMRNLVLIGTNTGTTVGLNIVDTGEPSASFLNYDNVVFEQFNTACLIGNYSYIIKFFGCYFSRSATGLSVPSGLTNAAEQVSVIGGGFTDCSSVAVNNGGANTSLVLVACSIDGNGITYVQQNSNGRTYCYGVHVEGLDITTQSVPMFNIGGGEFVFSGGDILMDGTGTAAMSCVFSIASGSRVVLTDRPLLNNLQNAGGVLCSGAGNCNILSPIRTFDSTKIPPIIGIESNFNLLTDGGFEQSTIQDTISIVGDVNSTITFTSGTPGVVNWSPHRQTANQPIRFTTTGTLPVGLTAGVIYYVSIIAGNPSGTFNISATPGGTAINLSDTGSGTHTCTALVWSRITGSHISLATSNAVTAHGGSKSLAATLNGGLGASFMIIVPCRPGQYMAATGWYRGASTQAVTANVTPGFASDLYYNTPVPANVNNTNPDTTGNIPVIVGGTTQTSTTLPSIPTSFTQFTTTLALAPSWAKYFYLTVNLNNLFNNTFYLDDLSVTGY